MTQSVEWLNRYIFRLEAEKKKYKSAIFSSRGIITENNPNTVCGLLCVNMRYKWQG